MTTGVPVYANHIDWNHDADFSDTGEDVSDRTASATVRWERGRDQIRALAPPMAGSLSCTLDNTSGDYSPENASSPLYGLVEPGRDLRFRCDYSATTYPLFRGYIDEPTIDSEGQTLGIRALGVLSLLAGQKVSTDLYTNITTDYALGILFGALGIGSKLSVLDTGKTTLAYWWCGEDDALEMAKKLLYAEGPGAALYEDASGLVCFHSRHYRLTTTRCKTSQATYSDTGTGSLHVTPYRYGRGRKDVINRVTIERKVLTFAGSTSALWTYSGGDVELLAGASRSFDVALSVPSGGGALSVNVTTAQDLIGAVPAYSALTSTIKRYNRATNAYDIAANSGTHFRVTVTNPNSIAVTLTEVRVDSNAGTVTDEPVTNVFDTSASIPELRTLPSGQQPWPYIDYTTAQGLADGIAYAYHLPRSQVEVTIENATETDLLSLLAREVSDRITIVDSRSHINGAFFVERLAHEVSEQGTRHRLTLGCERVWSDSLAIYGTSLYGTGRYWF